MVGNRILKDLYMICGWQNNTYINRTISSAIYSVSHYQVFNGNRNISYIEAIYKIP